MVTKLQRLLGDRLLIATKGEEDITRDIIRLFSGRNDNSPLIPSFDEGKIHFAINAILDFFKDIPAEKIFQDQYNILLKPVSADTGSRIRLVAVQGLPFLMFDNSSIIQIPLGQQDSTEVFKKLHC